jgi:nucleoside 2-deoxyribosyltransferase
MPGADSAQVNAITISGGIYHERCIWPDWDQIYGSGGRAAAALSGHVDQVTLRTFARRDTADRFKSYVATTYGFTFAPVDASQTISFEYVHSLSVPTIRPAPALIHINNPIEIKDEVVLRFGMMEGSAQVEADHCIYDPQSAFRPEPFGQNGSKAHHLAIVANRSEVMALGQRADLTDSAQALLKDGAEVVIVKMGVAGALVVDASGATAVPAFRTDRVWTIGSGDVFAAIFASAWGVHGISPVDAARFASGGVAEYVSSMALPIPSLTALSQSLRPEAQAAGGRVYLASPFFTLGQRWLVDDARRSIRELGMEVFSPVHDVGPGPAEQIAPADLAELDHCDAVFAILDGLDSGTLFEVGYARAHNKPVYALAQTVMEEDLKMVAGSGCSVFDDFVTALHHLAWRT